MSIANCRPAFITTLINSRNALRRLQDLSPVQANAFSEFFLDDSPFQPRLLASEMKAFGYTFSVIFILLAGVSASQAQHIEVESAYYGTPDRSRDVTTRVQRFADYGEPFRVSNDTFRMDPVPGQRKTLVVVYRVGGMRIRDDAQEGDVFYFRGGEYTEAGRAYHRHGIRILEAAYGTRGQYANVTRIVRNFALMGRPFTVSNQTFGIDPYPGVTKRLKILYFRNGQRRTQIYVEGDFVRL
jgi:hypothetical protein